MPGAGDASPEEQPFSHVVSLGSLCAAAAWLQEKGLRTGSGPFDWVFSSPAMVRHCLKDDFTAFLDRSQYQEAGTGIGHARYSSMLLGPRMRQVWRHHDPLHRDDHYELFVRNVERLRGVLRDTGARKLFVVCQLIESKLALQAVREGSSVEQEGAEEHHSCVQLGCREELLMLFDDLQDIGVRNFQLDAVYLCSGNASEAGPCPHVVSAGAIEGCVQRPGDARLAIHELHLLGEHTGLRFKDDRDNAEFTKLMREGQRRFDLVPMPGSSFVGARSPSGKRTSRYSDDAELARSVDKQPAKRPCIQTKLTSSLRIGKIFDVLDGDEGYAVAAEAVAGQDAQSHQGDVGEVEMVAMAAQQGGTAASARSAVPGVPALRRREAGKRGCGGRLPRTETDAVSAESASSARVANEAEAEAEAMERRAAEEACAAALVAELVGMGFERGAARRALETCRWDPCAAIDHLLADDQASC